jgi:low temperature requirement protein LtrA
VAKTAGGMVLGSLLIVAGAVVGGTAQTWFWLAGVCLDAGITYFTSVRGNWRVHAAAHWTERYGLIVILALGESIVSIGVGASQEPISFPILAGSVFGMALSICLWWLHFDVTAIAAEHRFAALRGAERSSEAVDAYTYLHLPLVAGIILAALGVEDVLAHVYESEDFGSLGSFALFGGAALYLFGSAAFWRRVGGGWKKWRLSGAVVLLLLIPAAVPLAPLTALGLVTAVTGLLVAVESTLYAETRSTIRSQH